MPVGCVNLGVFEEMPTYEYECTKCDHVFERFQSMRDEPLKRCPLCRCKVRRLLGSGAGIIFKGNGFYQTDYRSESYQKAAASERKTDSKPAAGDTATKPKKTEKPKTETV